MEYQHIERLLGLHEEIHIIYVVDRFESQFFTHDGETLYESGFGKTVRESLIDLDNRLSIVERLYSR
jgi:hypothetical protein